ncbi:DUF1003 domain-containing protein [Pedobacter montanisoli]|uniref:DUF1003 domain-containing protein n=1 Tax=Pedobacter montanisoli TaxID=2923277 RepID=A0ABS9ZWQ6_9SPHI|nr:DUF1003 domain-containing protein [Pedobacter montanisoli]MCJ0742733.1 DUF1003 domain-containing protein [Pedobacter montanisoli]
MTKVQSFNSAVSNKEFPAAEKVLGSSIRNSIFNFIQKDCPTFDRTSALSISELNYYRQKYISEYLVKEIGEVGELEKQVINALVDTDTVTDKLNDANDRQGLTRGQAIADKVASFGGSWTFIISFAVFLLLWIGANVYFLANKGFDPYPFILLNLILSCLAAIQAPVIMMSQNRQEEKDRERAKSDYIINLKSELEIRTLHEKIDHLIMNQQQELLEIQKVQIEMMTDILKQLKKAT